MNTRIPATVQRESGLIVPASLATVPERSNGNGKVHQGPPTCYDPDGRRRVIISDEERRLFDRLAKVAQDHGQGLVMVCRNDKMRPDGKPACGQPMQREDWDGPDKGYGCVCTRIHFA